MLLKAILLILIGSLIGWITNYIAIKMLFRPYKEINFGIFKLQGLIPKRQHEIGKTIANTIQTELISIEDILKKLENADMTKEMERVIDDILDEKLSYEIGANFPMLKMFLNDSMLEKIKSIIKKSIMDEKERIIDMLFTTLEHSVDFKSIIIEKIDNFSMKELEKITVALAKKELKHIELVGAILGAIIGAIQFILTVTI